MNILNIKLMFGSFYVCKTHAPKHTVLYYRLQVIPYLNNIHYISYTTGRNSVSIIKWSCHLVCFDRFV